jgi:hypothetical protein
MDVGEWMDDADEDREAAPVSRRALLGGSFVLAASGLLLPAWQEDAVAGERPVRRVQDRAERRRMQRNRRDTRHDERRDHASPGRGLFRYAALQISNVSPVVPVSTTFFIRPKLLGLDNWGPWEAQRTVSLGIGNCCEVTYRFAPERYRVGALLRGIVVTGDVFVDVRNLAFGFPQARVTQGPNLDPVNNRLGDDVIAEQSFAAGGEKVGFLPTPTPNVKAARTVDLFRYGDSEDDIEFGASFS